MSSSNFNFLQFFTKDENIIQVKAGQTIIEIGQHDNAVRILKSGKARLKLSHGRGFIDLEPGTLIGIMCFPIGRAYRNTCVAVTDCEVVIVDIKQVNFMIQEHPTFAIEIIKLMAERYNDLVDLVDHAFPSVKFPVNVNEIIDVKSIE